jgi:hypothetical protein
MKNRKYKLTPWRRVLLDKLKVAQVANTFPGFYETQRFCNILVFHGEEFLAHYPTPKLEDHLLSAV